MESSKLSLNELNEGQSSGSTPEGIYKWVKSPSGQRVQVGRESKWAESPSGQRVQVGGVSEWAESLSEWSV